MARSGRMWKLSGLGLVALLLCLWLGNQIYASHSRSVIEKTVAVVKDFQTRQLTLADARKRLQAVTGKEAVSSLDADGRKQIEYSLVAPQGGLKRLGRVFRFSISLKFDSAEVLTSKRVLLTSNSYACCSAEVWELTSLANQEPGQFEVARYDPYSIIVHLGSAASAVESQTAWDWQLSCLTSVDGCNDVRKVLPTVRPSYRKD